MIEKRQTHRYGGTRKTTEDNGFLRVQSQCHQRYSKQIAPEGRHAVDDSTQKPDKTNIEQDEYIHDRPRTSDTLYGLRVQVPFL